jgi:predicted RNA-binding Zn-ribbon protein involved in translation (DUF1610 family)
MEARYTREETSRLQQMFAPIPKRYRRHARTAGVALIGFMLWILLLLLVFRPSESAWGFLVPAFICWVVGLAAIVSAPALLCPACKERLDRDVGRYCPECGSHELQAGDWLRSPHCLSCGRHLRRHRTRHYKIRACTHCGLILDEKGF